MTADSVEDALIRADSILSLLHYRGIINSERNREDVEAAMNAARKALQDYRQGRR